MPSYWKRVTLYSLRMLLVGVGVAVVQQLVPRVLVPGVLLPASCAASADGFECVKR
jgi:hypothetical protein